MINSIEYYTGFVQDFRYFRDRKIEFTPGFNVLFGKNGCLSEDTLVRTIDGVKCIKDINVGDYVFSEEGKPVQVLHKFDTGVKDVVELISDTIVWAKCTLDHVWLSRTRGNGKKCIMVNDFYQNFQPIKRIFNNYKFTGIKYEKAYTIGAMIGDGCCKQSKTNDLYHISSDNEEVVKYISKNLNGEYIKYKGDNFTWRIKGDIKDQMYLSWCEDKYAHEKICDFDIIDGWDRETCLSFIGGIIDTDGSIVTKKRNNSFIINIGLQSKCVIDCLEKLFLKLWGISVTRSVDTREKYVNGPIYNLIVKKISDSYVCLNELEPFLKVESKRNKCLLIEKPYIFDYVGLTVGKLIKKVQTYDIHVDSETNLYCLANGLVTHNSGKSLTLRFLKAYCSIEKGGWSKLIDPKKLCSDQLPFGYSALSPDQTEASVKWDGSPVFYNKGEISVDTTMFYRNPGQSPDGITSEQDQFMAMAEKKSSGQYRLDIINKMLTLVKDPPNILEAQDRIYGNLQPQQDYLTSLPRSGRTTLLLDEPDRSLSLTKQKKLLEVLLEFSKDYQVIIACHSPFVCFLPEDQVNVIDIEEGYFKECKELFEQ